MKKKVFLAVLCTFMLYMSTTCSMGSDITVSISRNIGTKDSTAENLDASLSESEQEFFRNQKKSFDILENAVSPFVKGFNATTGDDIYDDSFAGVWITEDGNLAIGVVKNAISKEIETSINRLQGQVIFRYHAFSYNYLIKKMEALSDVMFDFGIYTVELKEDKNCLYIYLFDIDRVDDIKKFLSDQVAFSENALVFFDNPAYIPSDDSVQTAYGGRWITRQTNHGGTIGANAICNKSGKVGILTNEHVAREKDTIKLGNSTDFIIGTVERAKIGGTVDASFTPFQDPDAWDMTPNARDNDFNLNGVTHSKIRLGYEKKIVQNAKIMKIGVASGTTDGNIESTSTCG